MTDFPFGIDPVEAFKRPNLFEAALSKGGVTSARNAHPISYRGKGGQSSPSESPDFHSEAWHADEFLSTSAVPYEWDGPEAA